MTRINNEEIKKDKLNLKEKFREDLFSRINAFQKFREDLISPRENLYP